MLEFTVFPSMLHTLNFTSTQLWSKFTSLPLPDLSCLSHSCTPGFLRMLTWGQWLSPWRLILLYLNCGIAHMPTILSQINTWWAGREVSEWLHLLIYIWFDYTIPITLISEEKCVVKCSSPVESYWLHYRPAASAHLFNTLSAIYH